jgi:hypothetical protein
MSALRRLNEVGGHSLTATWERFASIQALTDRIRTTCRQAYAQAPITTPFQQVYVEDVTWMDTTCSDTRKSSYCPLLPPGLKYEEEEMDEEDEMHAEEEMNEEDEIHEEEDMIEDEMHEEEDMVEEEEMDEDEETDEEDEVATTFDTSDGHVIVPLHAHIDGARSCAAVYRCHLSLQAPTHFCAVHLPKMLAKLRLTQSLIVKMDIEHDIRPTVTLTDANWQLPADPVLMQQLQTLLVLTSTSRQNTCILTDVEFVALEGQSASIFQTCIKTYGASDAMVSTNVRYPGESLDTINDGKTNYFYQA